MGAVLTQCVEYWLRPCLFLSVMIKDFLFQLENEREKSNAAAAKYDTSRPTGQTRLTASNDDAVTPGW